MGHLGRDENINVFNDTERLSKTIYAKDVEASIDGQVIIKETDDIGNVPKDKYEEKAKVNVSSKRTCEAAKPIWLMEKSKQSNKK